jgi:hypothetical protein
MIPSRPLPSLARRHAELQALAWPGSSLRLIGGRELRFEFNVAPTPLSRMYRCLLKLTVARAPELLVLDPSPCILAGARPVPHVYPHKGLGTKLCLWLPKAHEWSAYMKLSETYLPWAAEWLDYFEEWLVTDAWSGGGEHPQPRYKRWSRASEVRI